MKPRVARILGALLLLARIASAERPGDGPRNPEGAKPEFRIGGYVEAFYQYNANLPSNHLTNLRDFDGQSDTFALSNAALEAEGEVGPVSGRLVLQYGPTPAAYISPRDQAFSWIQEVYAGYEAPIGRGLLTEAGIFLSPLGMEDLAVKDEWNWSRSNVWTLLPTYHAGVRSSYRLDDASFVQLAIYNGWNDIAGADGNKSIALLYSSRLAPALRLTAMYMGGPERPRGAPEGKPWRHLLDAFAEIALSSRLDAIVYTDFGVEPNPFGTAGWSAGALYARLRAADWLFFAARADAFFEKRAVSASGTSAPIFTNARWIGTGTLTVDVRPVPRASIRLEGRHDAASSALYYAGQVTGDGSSAHPYVPNARTQDTLTLGMTVWF